MSKRPVQRKASSKPGPELDLDQLRFLANLPQGELRAFRTLVAYGVDRVKLQRLIQNRARPVGRPANADETARLIVSVDYYLRKHPGASVKDAIDAILEQSGSYKRLSVKQRSAKKRSLEVTYSREIKKRQAQESESTEEYATRRKRELPPPKAIGGKADSEYMRRRSEYILREQQSKANHKTPPKT